ncbi:MAG: 30S ribosome-binding factor RbfA [Phycisphaerae bacterium]
MSRRTERVGSTLKRELQMIIMRELSDPRLVPMPTITRATVTEDLAEANVYVTVMGPEGKQSAALAALRSAAGHMRKRLGEMLEMRTIPVLKFQIDENLKKELELMSVLEEVSRELHEADAKQPQTDEAGPAGDGPAEDSSAEASSAEDHSAAETPAAEKPAAEGEQQQP